MMLEGSFFFTFFDYLLSKYLCRKIFLKLNPKIIMNILDNEQIKLRCLEIASQTPNVHGGNILKTAELMYDFVKNYVVKRE